MELEAGPVGPTELDPLDTPSSASSPASLRAQSITRGTHQRAYGRNSTAGTAN